MLATRKKGKRGITTLIAVSIIGVIIVAAVIATAFYYVDFLGSDRNAKHLATTATSSSSSITSSSTTSIFSTSTSSSLSYSSTSGSTKSISSPTTSSQSSTTSSSQTTSSSSTCTISGLPGAAASNSSSNWSLKGEIPLGNYSFVSGFLDDTSNHCLAMTVSSSVNGSYEHTSLADISSNKIIANVSSMPENSMALDSKDGLIFASEKNGFANDGSLAIYNSTTLALLKKIPVGINPSKPLYDPDNSRVYVGTYGFKNQPTTAQQAVEVINPKTMSVVQNISAGYFIHYLAYDSANHYVYAGNDGSLCGFCSTSNTTVIDPASGKVVSTIPDLFGEMIFSPATQELYLLNYSETALVQQLVWLNSSSKVYGSLRLTTNSSIAFSNFAYDTASGSIFISNSSSLPTGQVTATSISVFDPRVHRVTGVISLPGQALLIAIVSAGTNLYVSADTTPQAKFQANGGVFVFTSG